MPRNPSRGNASRPYATRGFLLGLATKNLSRYRRRTLITSSAIAFGVAVFVLMSSLLDGFVAESDRNLSNYEYGDAAITGSGYWEERDTLPLDILIEEPEEVLESLESLEQRGIAATPRTAFRGELIVRYDPFPEDGSVQRSFYGIDPQRDPEVFRLYEFMEEGRFLEPGENGVIMGRWLADRLGAEVGYPISVTTRTRDGFYQILDLEIVGIYDTPNPVVNRNSLYLPLDTVNRYLEMREAVTHIHISLPGTLPAETDPEPVREAVAGAGGSGAGGEQGSGGDSAGAGDGPGDTAGSSDSVGAEGAPAGAAGDLDVLSFSDMNEEMREIMEMEDAALNLVLFLLAIIAIVGISNTMLMAVLEREHEIGMMRAMGVRNGEVRRMFMYEAAGIGVIGAIGGVVLSLLGLALLVNYGIDYGVMFEGMEMGFRFDGVLYGTWNFDTMAVATVFAVLTAAVVAVFPTRRILKRTITDSLRHG